MDKKQCSSCGAAPHKCSCKNKEFTKAVIEIDNPEQITLMRRVVIPASMGDDTTVPPVVGKYHNVLLYYEANSKSYLYSSDGIPTQLVNGFTNYEEAINLPQINGVTLLGDKSAADLELADAPMVITVANGNTSWSGADTAEDVYDFFLNKGKVNIIFNGDENYSYEIASAAYIPGEEKMMCTLAVATMTGGGTTEFDGNALFGTMTLYTAGKAIDVSQIELQPKLYVTDFTGLDLSYNELSGVPATNASIGMVKSGDGLEVASDGNISVKAGAGITVDENGVSETPYDDYIEDIETHRVKYEYASNNTTSYVDYAIIPATYKPSIIMSDPANPNTRKAASEFDYEYKPTLMANFGPWNVGNDVTYGPLIIDGDIKVENNLTSGNTEWEQNIMGIDGSGRLVNIYGETTASAITVPNAIRSWRRLYEEGVSNPEVDPTQHNPHTWIAQDYDGNYLIAVCGGRNKHDTGMTADDQIRFVTTTVSFNARIIFNADGGGSSNLLYHGIRQNDLVEGEDRACPNWLVWSSPTAKHEGVFKNQSVNNSHNVYDFKRQRRLSGGYQYDADYIGTNFITAPAEVRSQSRITFPTPFSVIYNLEFYVDGEVGTTVAADTILLDNLPWTSGNYYVLGLNRSDDTPVQFVLRQETGADGHRYSTLRNVSAIPVRKNYTFNQTFWTAYRQFDE